MTEPSAKLARAIESARDAFPGPELERAEVDARFDALMTKMAASPPPRVQLLRRRWPLLLAAAAMLFGVVTLVVWRSRPLSYTIEGGIAEGGYVRTADSPAHIAFSDDSVVDVDPATRLRIVDRTDRGAHLVLEDGTVTAHVIHRSSTDWTIGAGPYEVHVVGTRFEVKWHAEAGTLDVHVIEGAVRLSGPSADALIRAPQTFQVQTRVAMTPPPPPPTADVALAPEDLPLVAPSSSQAAPPKSATASWSSLVGSGRFDAVISDAEREGESDVLAHRSAPDLAALADAARYTHHLPLAKRALEAERSRFAGSAAAADATFLLGKIVEDTDHDSARAIGHYDEYLTAAPAGTYAHEALGRKMMLERSTSSAAARTSAERYLRTSPNGSYAEAARQILGR